MSAPVDSALAGRRQDEYVAHVAVYREGFRRYLGDLDVADDWRAAAFTSAEDGLAHDATVMARLYADGWNRYGWPEAAGGLGGNEIHRAVYYEELGHAMLPIPAQHWTLETLGPALLKFAPGLAATYLPGYLAGWDVGLMPFAINESTRFISPTKTPECLAAGLPVVSTAVPDVVHAYGHTGLVEIAADAEEVVLAIERLLARRPRGWLA